MAADSADDDFRSILWSRRADAGRTLEDTAEAGRFRDLNLDQVVAAIDKAWPDERLAPFFHVPATDTGTIAWRQAVLRDLQQAALRRATTAFVEALRATHAHLAEIEKLYYPIEKQRARLGAANVYCTAVQTLTAELARSHPDSAGLQHLHAWLTGYTASATFTKLSTDGKRVAAALDGIRYDLLVRAGSVTVRPYADEADASVAVEATFAKFRPGGAVARPPPQGRIGFHGLNHVEAQVLDKVAMLNPQPFAALQAFCGEHADFIDPLVARFAREVCFYLAWLAYIAPLRQAGLPFCFPNPAPDADAIEASGAFDVALAAKLVADRRAVVCNGFALHAGERMLVVTGPNHGGKTTFARMFGQIHWLAALGLTIPAADAHLLLFDALFTHFERAERIETLRGKLKDDLVRIRAILDHASPRSLIVMNEIFSSTTLDDALLLGRRVLGRLSRLGALTVCVTFLTELADFDTRTASMVAEVDPQDPDIRTFRITRRPADGLAYALAVANKHRVTREWLLKRIAP
ncbi:MAG: MutS-related protein [Rhodanobacteraceae bacterium]